MASEANVCNCKIRPARNHGDRWTPFRNSRRPYQCSFVHWRTICLPSRPAFACSPPSSHAPPPKRQGLAIAPCCRHAARAGGRCLGPGLGSARQQGRRPRAGLVCAHAEGRHAGAATAVSAGAAPRVAASSGMQQWCGETRYIQGQWQQQRSSPAVQENAYVPAGVKCRILVALALAPDACMHLRMYSIMCRSPSCVRILHAVASAA